MWKFAFANILSQNRKAEYAIFKVLRFQLLDLIDIQFINKDGLR